MLKRVGSMVIILLSGLLLVYSASRSLAFISLTLPPERQILALFGLAALDGGLIAWLLAFLYGARGWQRPLAGVMIIIDLVGAVTIFTMDTWYNVGQAGLIQRMTSDQIQTGVIVLCGVIGINIVATVLHLVIEPEQLQRIQEEEALDKIEEATLRKVGEQAEQLAAELAPKIAADWSTRTRAKYSARINTKSQTQSAAFSPMISYNQDMELVATNPKDRKNGGPKS